LLSYYFLLHYQIRCPQIKHSRVISPKAQYRRGQLNVKLPSLTDATPVTRMQLYLKLGNIPCHSKGAQRLKNLCTSNQPNGEMLHFFQHDRPCPLDCPIKSGNDMWQKVSFHGIFSWKDRGLRGVPYPNKNPPKSPFDKGGLRGIGITGG
jgi:hypothetical protein